MAGVRRFEDLVAWQRARELAGAVYKATSQGTLSRDYGLRNQMQTAATSIMANIAEGFERNRASEFHQFLSVAKASCAEVRSHLYVAFDAGHLEAERFERLMRIANETARVVAALRTAVARTRDNTKH